MYRAHTEPAIIQQWLQGPDGWTMPVCVGGCQDVGRDAVRTAARVDFQSVEEYIAAQPEGARVVLALVRTTIREALPGAEETTISYQMPAYRVGGETVIYWAGWKRHYSLYPVSARLVEGMEDDLAGYELNGRGTLRFPLAEPVPVKLIGRIAKRRAQEVAGRVGRARVAR